LKEKVFKKNENVLMAAVLLSRRRKEVYVPEVLSGDNFRKKLFGKPLRFKLDYTVYGVLFFLTVLTSFSSRKPAWYWVTFLSCAVFKRPCFA